MTEMLKARSRGIALAILAAPPAYGYIPAQQVAP